MSTKNVNLFDYSNTIIYPYVQLSSIKVNDIDESNTDLPIHKYIKSVAGDSEKFVDKTSQQTISGKKTFIEVIDGTVKCAQQDANGNIIDQTYATIDELKNISIDLSNYVGDVNITGNVSIDGEIIGLGFYESSDERIKTFNESLNIDLDKLSTLKKSKFVFNDNPTKEYIGVSAQEIQKMFPEIVSLNHKDDILQVDYSKLSVIALAAIDKLYKENISLKNDIKIIKSKLNIN